MNETIPASEAAAGIRAAQEALEQEAARLAAIDDPATQMVATFAMAAGAQHRLAVDASLNAKAQQEAIAQLVQRPPVPPDELRRAVAQGIGAHAGNLVQAMNWRNAMLGATALVGIFVGGAGLGYAFHGAAPVLAGVRAGVERCEDRPDGSRLCWIPVWERLPPQTGR